MADYHTHFSCLFDVGSAANVENAGAIRDELASYYDSEEASELVFDMKRNEYGSQPGSLWISSDGGGNPEHVIAFVLRCAETFDMKGTWGFCWANTCSRMRLDGFGGGAQIIDLTNRRSRDWVDLAEWVVLRDDDIASDGAVPTAAGDRTAEAGSAP